MNSLKFAEREAQDQDIQSVQKTRWECNTVVRVDQEIFKGITLFSRHHLI
jgi:hypothetical protein